LVQSRSTREAQAGPPPQWRATPCPLHSCSAMLATWGTERRLPQDTWWHGCLWLQSEQSKHGHDSLFQWLVHAEL